jgi:hypothetical protein
MSEWWTYRLSDFLLFSPETYYRLFELYNRDLWPLHLVTFAAGLVILVLRGGRLVAAILAASWLWVAWAFHLQRYATINWAATWFAGAFIVQALLLIWTGIVRNRLGRVPMKRLAQRFGMALFVFALFLEPLVAPISGRPWIQAEVFGMAPDPTAVGTVGIILFSGERVRVSLLIIPLLWCVVSGATLWAMA